MAIVCELDPVVKTKNRFSKLTSSVLDASIENPVTIP